MKILTHPAMLALGIATLCLLIMISPLVSPYHNTVYHLSGSIFSIWAPMLINLGVLWFALTILLWFARRPGWFRIVVWTSVIILQFRDDSEGLFHHYARMDALLDAPSGFAFASHYLRACLALATAIFYTSISKGPRLFRGGIGLRLSQRVLHPLPAAMVCMAGA